MGSCVCVCCVAWGQLHLLVILLQERRREIKWGESERGAYLFSVIASARTHTHTHTQPLGATQLGLSCVRGDTYIHTICK